MHKIVFSVNAVNHPGPKDQALIPPQLPAPLPARRAYRPEGRAYSSEREAVFAIRYIVE